MEAVGILDALNNPEKTSPGRLRISFNGDFSSRIYLSKALPESCLIPGGSCYMFIL
jgi:hypothetical protein